MVVVGVMCDDRAQSDEVRDDRNHVDHVHQRPEKCQVIGRRGEPQRYLQQSISQSINQAIKQSIDQSINHLFKEYQHKGYSQ